MYLTLLASVVGLAVGAGCWLLDFGWFFSFLLALVGFIATWILVGRAIGKRIQPVMALVQRQMEARMVDPAIETLRSLLRYGNWVPLLKGTVYAQIGLLTYHSGRPEQAIDALNKAGRRSGDAQLLLGCIRFRDGKKDDAFAILEKAILFSRKHVLLHNVYAWLLNRESRRDDAIRVLNRLIAKQANETTSDNLLRLQNDQKLNMKSFGLEWYALGFEHPPASMGELRPIRKGFRTPPKQRGKS